MRLNCTYRDIAEKVGGEIHGPANGLVHEVCFDTRRISSGQNGIFLCLKSLHRDGHDYIEDAYETGVRCFLVSQRPDFSKADLTYILVKDVLQGLQLWAKKHRLSFKIPVIAITGSAGKTVVKEQLYHLLSSRYGIARSPKSFNSQLGVALSLLEITSKTEIALIEAGISAPGEMKRLAEIVCPTHGIFTGLSSNHSENFASEEDLWQEKKQLFASCEKWWSRKECADSNCEFIDTKGDRKYSVFNRLLYQKVCAHFDLALSEGWSENLPQVALRMELTEGMYGTQVLRDAYNWTFDGLQQAMEELLNVSLGGTRFLFFDPTELDAAKLREMDARILEKGLTEVGEWKGLTWYGTDQWTWPAVKEASVLIKGNSSSVKRLAQDLQARKHSTWIEINTAQIKRNLSVWRSYLPKEVDLIAMVKASSYGSELAQIGQFFQRMNFAMIGVAFVDEGVELRQNGVELPILVMNAEQSSWSTCIQYNLEPAIYSLSQLDGFIKELILADKINYPVHLKIDTGMHRLGFERKHQQGLIDILQSQPEVNIKTIYSHLAMSGDEHEPFTKKQLADFQQWKEELQDVLSYPIKTHVLNSHNSLVFGKQAGDYVRLGIGLYGITGIEEVRKKLKPVLSWKTRISQIKELEIGEGVGYGQTFIAKKPTTIATLPVGYADGFSRMLSNGVGQVFWKNKACKVLGSVCMDMIMVDITNLKAKEGDEMEIIGEHQTIETIASACGTIPYEVMTGLSRRMPRIYLEE